MIDTLIIHGSFGNPTENWFPWLATKLTERGRRVLLPHLPDKELQNLANWSTVLSSYRSFFGGNLTVYAHSLAPAFIVDYCVENDMKLEKAVFVSPFYGLISIEEFDDVNRSFFVDENYFSQFADLCSECVCVFSDDDPYVPRELADRFAMLAKARVEIVSGGKHLNAGAGFEEFPLLLEV